ncbi:ABC-three component system protein [Sorangium sp. So ce362]|uniref:ABC-three component system protein n=1 Tax=Sorangium sp. So ce362 TaxID=3133303 RepID=UPI003F5F09F1
MGRDVVGYIDTPSSGGRLDIFQCKHYGHPLHPGDVWTELGKLCYYTFIKAFAVPEVYRFVAPEDVGPELGRLLEKSDELRTRLIAEWAKHVEGEIVKKTKVKLEGKLLEHVEAFDFSRVGYKPIHEIIEEHKKTTRYAPRFGGGLVIPRQPDPIPPAMIESHEQRYVEQLIEAYQDHNATTITLATLASHDEFNRHFLRSRERYFCAEGLRRDVRDNLPDGVTFEQVQDQVHETVIDTAEDSGHASGFVRVKVVTDKASLYQLQDHPLRTYMKSKLLMGICHQLANADRLKWVLK